LLPALHSFFPKIECDDNFFKVSSSRLRRPMCGSGYALPEALEFFWGLRPDCLSH